MRLLYAALVISLAVSSSGCGSRGQTPTPEGAKTAANDPQALEQLKGAWHVTGIEAAGKPVPSDRVQKIGMQYVFEGDKVTIRRPDRPDNTSTITLDPSASPKKMTINQSPAVHAVYAVDGNKLRLCVMVDESPNAGYPSELVSKPSPKTDLLTLERRAPGAQGPGTAPAGGAVYIYSQSTGKLTLNDQLVCVGYSGKGAAKNNPAKQADKDGPIPIGEYLLTGFRDEPKLGGKIMGLLPVAGTNFFKRFPGEVFAIIAETDHPPSGCFIVVGRDVLDKLSALNTKLRVVK